MSRRGVWLLAGSLMVLLLTGCAGAAPASVPLQNEAAPAQGTLSAGTALGDQSKQIGELTVSLSSLSGKPVRGRNTLQALVVDRKGAPVTDALLSFDIDMTNMSHGKNVTQAPHVSDGRYSANLTFMMPGPWRLIVAVQRGGQQVGAARFDFNVNMR